MSFCSKVLRQLNELKLEKKQLILENLTDVQIEELMDCAYNIKKLSNNKYLILEN